MVGKTFKKVIAKAGAAVTTAALCAGCLTGFSFAASPQSVAGLPSDFNADMLSLVMDSALELVQNPYENLIVTNYEPYLAVYKSADEDSEIVGKMYPGSYGTIVHKGEMWTKITSGDVTGFVLTENVAFGDEAEALAKDTGEKVVKVTVDQLNIRSGPDFYSPVIASGEKDETYLIVPEGCTYDEHSGEIYWTEDGNSQELDPEAKEAGETSDGAGKDDEKEAPSYEEFMEPIDDLSGGQWYRIHLDDIYYGYVYGDCVETENQLDEAVTSEVEAMAASEEVSQTVSQSSADDLSKESAALSVTSSTGAAASSSQATGAKETQESQSQTSQSAASQTQTSQTQESETQESETQAPETQTPETQTSQTQAPETQAAQTEAPQTEAPVSASTDDAYLLACLVYCEAGNQSYEGQLAVANVVMNRVNSPLFPNSISEVIYQSGQFSPAANGRLATVLSSGPTSSCIQAANDAIAGNNNIGNYLFFNNYAPSDASSTLTIGDIVFYTYNY